MCDKKLLIGETTYYCIIERDTHDGSHKFLIRDDDVNTINAAQQYVQRNMLTCEEDGCNEPAVMFYCETHAP